MIESQTNAPILLEEDSTPPPAKVTDFNFGTEFTKMIFLLALVIGLLMISAWFLKRLMKQRLESMNDISQIKILERRIINQKTIIYIVELPGKRLVIGESPSGLVNLTELPPENASEDQTSSKSTSPKSFGDILHRKIKQDH